MSITYVVAGNLKEFQDYTEKVFEEYERLGKPWPMIHYVGAVTDLPNCEVHGVFIGSFLNRNDIRSIVSRIRHLNSIPISERIIPIEVVDRWSQRKQL